MGRGKAAAQWVGGGGQLGVSDDFCFFLVKTFSGHSPFLLLFSHRFFICLSFTSSLFCLLFSSPPLSPVVSFSLFHHPPILPSCSFRWQVVDPPLPHREGAEGDVLQGAEACKPREGSWRRPACSWSCCLRCCRIPGWPAASLLCPWAVEVLQP